jgi:hypothetical protein
MAQESLRSAANEKWPAHQRCMNTMCTSLGHYDAVRAPSQTNTRGLACRCVIHSCRQLETDALHASKTIAAVSKAAVPWR